MIMKRLNLAAFMSLDENGMRFGNRTPLGISTASVYLGSFVTRVLTYFMQRDSSSRSTSCVMTTLGLEMSLIMASEQSSTCRPSRPYLDMRPWLPSHSQGLFSASACRRRKGRLAREERYMVPAVAVQAWSGNIVLSHGLYWHFHRWSIIL
jgi:hypothetical protein